MTAKVIEPVEFVSPREIALLVFRPKLKQADGDPDATSALEHATTDPQAVRYVDTMVKTDDGVDLATLKWEALSNIWPNAPFD